jgi:hypothetical protein
MSPPGRGAPVPAACPWPARGAVARPHSQGMQDGNKGTDKTKPTENLKIPSPAGTSPSPAIKKTKIRSIVSNQIDA